MLNIKELANVQDSPLLLFSSESFSKRYRELQEALPQVKHHYALKSLPYARCIELIRDCDGYLDVASLGEIRLVQQTAPEMLPRCIYTHPVKRTKDIETALDAGIQVMVADNPYELEKLKAYADRVKVLIRIAFPNPGARCDLSAKFGAAQAEVAHLIEICMRSGIQLIGCSFHPGSQMTSPDAHLRAIQATRNIYDWFEVAYGSKLPVLNIGGGFPARLDQSVPGMATFCKPIRNLLQSLFPDTEIWSEPGRSIAADSMAAVSRIIGKAVKNRRFWYYLDDGVYNTFSGKLYDHADYCHEPLESTGFGELFDSVLAGPTCDSIDILKDQILLPEMHIGDLFITRQVGAYGWASRTDFNMLDPVHIIEVPFDLMPDTDKTGKRFPADSLEAAFHLVLS
jgi:ornithine decarboxylase